MIILLAMPLIFILVLGVSSAKLWPKAGRRPGRSTVLNLDEGVQRRPPNPKFSQGPGPRCFCRISAETADIRVEFVRPTPKPSACLKRTGNGPRFSSFGETSANAWTLLLPGLRLARTLRRRRWLTYPGDPVSLLRGGFDETQDVLPLYFH